MARSGRRRGRHSSGAHAVAACSGSPSSTGTPVAFAIADRSPVGLFLAGGATLPEARGRGCYRALVRARWDEAIGARPPGLAVQAQYESSAPILRRLGFVETATIHTLRSPATGY